MVFAWVGVRVKSRASVRFTGRIRYWFKVHIRVGQGYVVVSVRVMVRFRVRCRQISGLGLWS